MGQISKMNKQVNIFTTMESMIPNIKTQVMALKTTTDGFVRIKTRKNVNGNVTTTIFTNNQTTPTGEVVIKVNETYFDKPKPPSPTLDPRPPSPKNLDNAGKESFKRSQAKLKMMKEKNAQEIVNQHIQQRQGGRRSCRCTRRNSKKTRRVKKHSRRSHRGTRRV